MALKVKVGLIGALDMLKFKNLSKTRREAIEALPERPLPKTYETNEKANFMHPKYQDVRIKAMVPNGSDAVTVTLCSLDGRALAPFRAGQYVSISVDADASTTTSVFKSDGIPYHLAIIRERELNLFALPHLDSGLDIVFGEVVNLGLNIV